MYIKPLLSEKRCGDTGVILVSEHQIFIALLDVLGHGEEAYEVAIKAKYFLENNYKEDLVELTNELHNTILNTRGLVGSLVNLDINSGQINYVGIGNIVSRVIGPQYYKFVNREGIIGYKIPTPRVERHTLKKGDVFIMHSDGINENSGLNYNDEIFQKRAMSVAREIVGKYSKKIDDSVCFILKYNW